MVRAAILLLVLALVAGLGFGILIGTAALLLKFCFFILLVLGLFVLFACRSV